MTNEHKLFQDANQAIDVRVDDLLTRMNLDEKLAQIGCVWSTQLVEEEAFSEQRAGELLGHGTGHITRVGSATGLRPRESAQFMNRIQRFLVEETRLGIPAIVHEESCAGFTARDATQFPQAIGLASTWEPDLIESMGAVIRRQMLAVGARHTLAPVLDVARDPRWGRTEETFGEDPYLTSRMGVAYVRGVQGEHRAEGVVATGKHFLGYGLSEGGMNHAPAHIGPRELRETFARPFEAAIREAGLGSVMNAYSEVDGLACGGSKEILDDLLRGELGFDGVVVADYFTTRLLESHHKIANDRGEAGQIALEAGIDVELPQLDCYGAPLKERIERGEMSIELVDRSLSRLLRMKFNLGLFENPYVDEAKAAESYGLPDQVALAKEIAVKSIVLLKNEDALLPLRADIAKIAIIGPSADDVRLLQGDYNYTAHVEFSGTYKSEPAADFEESTFRPGPYFPPMTSVLESIRGTVATETDVLVARGCDISGESTEGFKKAAEVALNADVAVVCVGGKSGLTQDCTSGEFRDASDLGLTGMQQELVEAVVATGTPTVVVLINGRPFALPWIAEHVPAIVEAWLPGQEGGNAVADILFGKANPSGRLPVSLPRSVGQVPLYYNHKAGGGRSQMLGDYVDGPTTALYPFGHGLTYTQFEYENLTIDSETPSVEDVVRIAVDVSNVGTLAGEEVVQLYINDVVASCTRPVKQLAGFKRVPLVPGETRRVIFYLDLSQLGFFDPRMRFVVEPGNVRVMIGASSDDICVEGEFVIEGSVRELTTADIVSTKVEVESA